MSIQSRIQEIRKDIPQGVTLAVVSKFHPKEAIEEAYAAGERIFAESKVQELLEKQPQLPQDISWHFIGHLQTNKVKYIVPFIDLIQSVDSTKLLKEINKHAKAVNRKINVLLQIHIAQEEHKFGFSAEEALEVISQSSEWEFINIVGLMGMATFTDDEEQIKKEFDNLRALYDQINDQAASEEAKLTICSFGMSDDYPIAIAHGSNMVRIGSSIFGQRNY